MNWQGRHDAAQERLRDLAELRTNYTEEEIKLVQWLIFKETCPVTEYSSCAICLLIGGCKSLRKAKKAA